MVELIEEVKLVANKDDRYTMYVFQNLETKKYIMCTRMPNWQVPDVQVGNIGFLKYAVVQAGDTYYDVITEEFSKFKYSNVYFINFILKTEILHNNEIIL